MEIIIYPEIWEKTVFNKQNKIALIEKWKQDSKINLDNGTSYWIQKHVLKALFTHEKKKEYFLPGIPESSFTQIQGWVLTQKMVFWSNTSLYFD